MLTLKDTFFFTIGVNSVSKGGGVKIPDFLRDIGANTLGCWSDETINEEALHPLLPLKCLVILTGGRNLLNFIRAPLKNFFNFHMRFIFIVDIIYNIG